jgi:hypothetical protein
MKRDHVLEQEIEDSKESNVGVQQRAACGASHGSAG